MLNPSDQQPCGNVPRDLSIHDSAGHTIVQHLVCQDQKLLARIQSAFATLLHAPTTRKSHFFGGRYENIYPDLATMPDILPLREQLLMHAKNHPALQDHAQAELRFGFWFNLMQPGHSTTLHTHEDGDELLSGVCYLDVPKNSGAILFQIEGKTLTCMPQAGDILLFSPALPHAVEENRSQHARLSLAFNIGL